MEVAGRIPTNERDLDRLQRTLDAARLLQSTLNLKELTAIILEIVRNEVPVDRVTAFIVDHKHNVVRSLIAQGVDGAPITVPIGEGIAGFVAKTRQALDVTDAYADSRFNREFDRTLGYRTNDILAFPILSHNGAVIGVLELLNRKQPINENDLEFLQDVSVFIGLALDNARLHEEVQHKARLEEELARSRERLVQMDRLVLIGEVLSTVMKELTTPASVVMQHTAVMKVDPDITPGMLRNIHIIESATSRSKDAVSSFVDFVQKQKGARAEIDIGELIRQTLASRAFQWALDQIQVEEQLDPVPLITGNYGEIQQALLNVIKNAEEAVMSNQGPRLLTVRLSHNAVEKKVRIDIGDNGAGIPIQLYERIFEPFYSTKRESARTGLGLTIANRIIQEHHGEILFDTNVGAGTVFTIELPVPV